MIDREYFTLVFKGDIGKFKLNPMNTETPFGRPEGAGRGDAFDECEGLRERVETLEGALLTSTTMLEALLVQLNSWGYQSAVNARGQISRNEELLAVVSEAGKP